MIYKKSWDEFQKAGLLWWVNRVLHLFGWAIVVEVEVQKDGTPEETVVRAYPARVGFRGFTVESEMEGFRALTRYLAEESVGLQHYLNTELPKGKGETKP